MLGYPIVYRKPEGEDAPPRYLAGQVIGGDAQGNWTLLLASNPPGEPLSLNIRTGTQQGGGRGQFHLAGQIAIDLLEAEHEAEAAEAKAKADAEAAANQEAGTKAEALAKAEATAQLAVTARAVADEARAAADEAEARAKTAAAEAAIFIDQAATPKESTA